MAELFPNAPLRDATFEVRFLGELIIEARRHEFREKIRSKYPKLYVPNAQPGVSPPLQPYSFKDQEETTSLNLAINTFSMTTSRYLGFEAFKTEFLSSFDLFQEIFRIPKITRTGLRYVNHIPVLRESGVIPLKDYLNVGLRLPTSIPEAYEDFSLFFVTRVGEGKMRCIVQYQVEQPQGRGFLVLDFDYSIEGDLEPSRMSEFLEVSHRHTKEIFLSLLTDDYISVMRGETQ